MRCSEFEAELNHLLDERLPMQLSSQAVIHSSKCQDCQELLTGYQALFAVSPTGNSPPVKATSVVLPPKKHHERGCRDGMRLFDRSSNRKLNRSIQQNQLEQSQLGESKRRPASTLSRIPVALPDGQAPESRLEDKSSNEVAHTVTPGSETQRKWGLGSILVALVPSAAAVYLLGFGLLSQCPQAPTATSSAPDQLGIAAVQPPNAGRDPLAKADFPKIDWEKTASEWDQQWKRLAFHRASACQMPGVQPYFYSVNGAVEALRNNVIRRDKSQQTE